MTFTTAVAGPSRAGRVSLIASRVGGVRRASSAATEADTADDAVDDADVRRAKAQEKAFWEGEAGYTTWMSKVGSQYRTTAKGQRAKWLGGRTVGPHPLPLLMPALHNKSVISTTSSSFERHTRLAI